MNQVCNEIKKTIYGSKIRVVSLASRQNYCINSEVKGLNANDLINEKCLDLQKSKSSVAKIEKGNKRSKVTVKQSKCIYHAKDKFDDMKNEIISEIIDIEDLVSLGKEMKVCPYYSSKLAIDHAHIVLLPYQMLLNDKIRSQFNLEMKNNIVIIDEAHNLLDTLSDMYSASINLSQLESCFSQLKLYLDKYITRMKPTNIVIFKRLVFVIQRLIKMLQTLMKSDQQSKMLTTVDLLYEGEFANINLHEIIQFSDDTRLADKVHGFAKNYKAPLILSIEDSQTATQKLLKNLVHDRGSKKNVNQNKIEKTVENIDFEDKKAVIPSVIRPVLRFLECLTDQSDAGRILICKNDNESTKCRMKYMLLKPNDHFNYILNNCRSVCLFERNMYLFLVFIANVQHN